MQNELKPCPFCGNEAEQDYHRAYRALRDGKVGDGVAVYCTSCNAEMMLCHADHPGVDGVDLMHELVVSWNKRTAALASQPEAGAVEAVTPEPFCMWHPVDLAAYAKASQEEREAWNRYCEIETEKFDNDPRRDSYDSTRVFPGWDRDGVSGIWCPPLWFPEWLEHRNKSAHEVAAPAPYGMGKAVETSLIDLLDEAITTNDDNFRKWLIARGYAPAPSGMGKAVEAKLELIAAMKGQTLISAEHGQPYSIGANAAFEQCAELAREALFALKAEEAGS